jgi:Ketosteroid isomerase-related protein
MATATAGELLVQMLRAIERNDLAAIGALMHEDGCFDTPYGPGEQTIITGREAVVALLGYVGETLFAKVTFTVDREYAGADPAFAFAEYRSKASLHDGGTYANRYIAVCEARDGQIMLFREYFNPLAVIDNLTPA